MICPFCGGRVDTVRIFEKAYVVTEWVMERDGTVEERERDVEESEVVSCSLPCCDAFIMWDSFVQPELFLKGKVILMPKEKCPNGNDEKMVVKYKGKLYLAKEEVTGESGWSFDSPRDFIVFYEYDYCTQAFGTLDESKLVRKRLEKVAKEITDEDLVIEEEEEGEE